MSETLEVRAELLKLSRLLGVGEGELDYLEGIPSAELRQFRESATERLFDDGAKMLGRVGAAAKLVPAGLTATIAQKAFGPLLCARSAGMVDAGKAVDVARRLPADFLADVVIDLDPRRVVDIIAQVPAELVTPVARELGSRGEHVTMGRFLAFVPDHLIGAAMGALTDEAMLHTAFVLEHKDRLDHAVGLLPPERLPGVLQSAAGLGLWPEVLDLLDQSDRGAARPDRRPCGRPGRGPGGRPGQVGLGAGDLGQPAARRAPDVRCRPGPRSSPSRSSTTPRSCARSSRPRPVRASGWTWFRWSTPCRTTYAAQWPRSPAASIPKSLLNNVLAEAVNAPETFETLLRLVNEMPASGQAKVVGLIDEARKPLAKSLLASLSDPEEGSRLYELLPPDFRDAVERAAERLGLQKELSRRPRTRSRPSAGG